MEKSDKTFEGVFKSNLDNLIPLTVFEVEKQIKTEKEIVDQIIDNETNGQQMDCFQIRQELLQIGALDSPLSTKRTKIVMSLKWRPMESLSESKGRVEN